MSKTSRQKKEASYEETMRIHMDILRRMYYEAISMTEWYQRFIVRHMDEMTPAMLAELAGMPKKMPKKGGKKP